MAEINATSGRYSASLEAVLDSLLTDITNIRSAFNTAMTKLNSDAGVSDTNYAAATALTTTT